MASEPNWQAEPRRGSLNKHHDLAAWVVRNGGYIHPAVDIAFDPTKGYHARVKPGSVLPAGTRIASCPTEATLSVLNPFDIEPFTCRGVRFPRSFLDRFSASVEIIQAFFLMEHYLLGSQSWWGHYLATLPSPVDVKMAQFDLPEDKIWLRGTNLDGAIDIQLSKWHQSYTAGLEELHLAKWETAQQGLLTWELYRWAATIFGTRSFTSQVLSDTKPADLARPLGQHDSDHLFLHKLFSERFAVLLPLLDVLNHKPGAQIEWQARYSFVGLQVLEQYNSEQELYNNYGPRDNESLLLSYGFVLVDNPFDHVVVSIRTPPGSPLDDTRSWPPDSRSNDLFNCYIFGPRHPIVQDGANLERVFFSYDLLDSISVLVGNDRELQTMYSHQRTLMSVCLPSGFSDFRNLLATISQLMQDCRARAQRLKMSDPSETSQPTNRNQANAQLYRRTQLDILENAITVCAFIIFRACTDIKQEDILQTMEAKLPDFYHGAITRAFDKFTCLTRQRELLTVDAVLSMLPHRLSIALQDCIKNITALLEEERDLTTSHSDVIKAGFAVALGAIGWEYMEGTLQGMQLTPRLSSWFHDLVHWYPPTDEDWSYVPHAGPWPPGEEPPAALLLLLATIASKPDHSVNPWLNPRFISWGWNVLEEEGVRVPVEIERFCNGIVEAGVEEGAIGFLLYCKQYG